jgi:very-short-patch-repair endonuclease
VGIGDKGKFTSEEVSVKNRSRIWTPEMRAKVAASVKAYAAANPDSKETREKKGVKLRGKKLTPEHIKNISIGKTGLSRPDMATGGKNAHNRRTGPWTEEMKTQKRVFWASKSKEEMLTISQNGRNKVIEMYREGQPTSLELIVMKILDSLEIKYIHNFQMGPFSVDFWIDSYNLVIEADGEYWHSLPGRASSDKRRDTWLTNRGYKILRLPESIIKSGCEDLISLALSAD